MAHLLFNCASFTLITCQFCIMCQTCTGNDSKSCSDSNEAEVVDLCTVVGWLALSLYWEKPLAQIPPGTLPCEVCVFYLLVFSGKMVHLGVHVTAHVWVWSCNRLATCPGCIPHFFNSDWERVQHLHDSEKDTAGSEDGFSLAFTALEGKTMKISVPSWTVWQEIYPFYIAGVYYLMCSLCR